MTKLLMMKRLLFILGMWALTGLHPAHAQNKPDLGVNTPPGSITFPLPALPPAYPAGTPSSPLKHNYTRTWIPQLPIQDESQVNENTTPADVLQRTVYMDGKGKAIQQIARNAVSTTTDLITAEDTRANPRQNVAYLPYTLQNAGSNVSFRTDVFNEQNAHYAALYPQEGNTALSLTVQELRPADGILLTKTYAPGKSQLGQGYYTESYTQQNASGVLKWTLDANGFPVLDPVPYNGDEILQRVTQNTQGSITHAFTDRLGRVVKTAVRSGTSGMQFDDTYYIYDAFGRKVYTFPPKAMEAIYVNGNVVTQNILDHLCPHTIYDELGRVCRQQIPGENGQEEMVYDRQNRMVLSRDPNLSAQNKWFFTLYDPLGRTLMTGLYTGSYSRQDLQFYLDGSGSSTQTLTPATTSVLSLLRDGYSPAGNAYTYPSSFSDAEIMKYYYYDTYTYLNTSAFGFSVPATADWYPDNYANKYGVDVALRSSPRGMLTGTKEKVLKSANSALASDWLIQVHYYDPKGRMIQAVSYDDANRYLGRHSLWYAFNGSVLREIQEEHYPYASPAIQHTTCKKYVYQANTFKLLSASQKIDGGNWVVVTSNAYAPVTGQLASKSLGNVETQVYTYDIRGRLSGINADYAETGMTSNTKCTFGESIKYEYGFTDSRTDGLISGIVWKTPSYRSRAYGYEYDYRGQLLHAEFSQLDGANYTLPAEWGKQNTDFTVSNLSYDRNGNIQSVHRRGMGLVNNQVVPVDVDDLTYTYMNNGLSNQLLQVEDGVSTASANTPYDFHDHHSGNDYTYDANGNRNSDLNKDAQSISYNVLNKPEKISFASGNTIEYSYTAGGSLIETYRVQNGQAHTIRHVGAGEYLDDALQCLFHAQGKARYTGTAFEYDFFVRDHLDNVRTVVTAEEVPVTDYLATHELISANTETLLFENIDDVRDENPDGTVDLNNVKVAKLLGSDPDRRVGTALLLHGMAGDKFNLTVHSLYYDDENGNDGVDASSMLGSILGTFGGGSQNFNMEGGNGLEVVNSVFNDPNYLNSYQSLKNGLTDNSKPKAYLNYIVFDEDFHIIPGQSGALQVGTADVWNVLQTNGDITLDQSGYVAVYISNESMYKTVYFDDLELKFYRGKLVEENHYYPFGQVMRQAQANTANPNDYLYQTKELQTVQTGQNNDELGWFDFHARQYDPLLGSFTSLDPLGQFAGGYTGMGNNPVSLVDPSGMSAWSSGSPPITIPLSWSTSTNTSAVVDGVEISGSLLNLLISQGLAFEEKDYILTLSDGSTMEISSGRLQAGIVGPASIGGVGGSTSGANQGGNHGVGLNMATAYQYLDAHRKNEDISDDGKAGKLLREVVISAAATTPWVSSLYNILSQYDFHFSGNLNLSFGAQLGLEEEMLGKGVGGNVRLAAIDILDGGIDITTKNGMESHLYVYDWDSKYKATHSGGINFGFAGANAEYSHWERTPYHNEKLTGQAYFGPFEATYNYPSNKNSIQDYNHGFHLTGAYSAYFLLGIQLKFNLGIIHK